MQTNDPTGEHVDGYREIICKTVTSQFDRNSVFLSDNEGSLNIFHLNIRSCNKNFDELTSYLEGTKVKWDFIILGETWLGEEVWSLQLEGYKTLKTTKGRSRCDGVLVYVSERVCVSEREVELGDVYGLSMDFTYHSKQCNLLAIYRTHGSDLDNFTDALRQHYAHTARGNTYIFVGDVNANLIKTDAKTERYLDVMYESGFSCGINKPTRVIDNSMTCIDHVFVKHYDNDRVQTAVIHTFITDHYSIALHIQLTDAKTCPDTQRYTFLDQQKLSNLINNCDWSCVTDCSDLQTCSNLFTAILKNFTDASKKCNVNTKNRTKKLKPWINAELIDSIRKRDKLSKRLKRQPFNTELKTYFITFRARLKSLIRTTKNNYYRAKIATSNNDPKLFWQTVNEITGKTRRKDVFPLQQYISDRQYDCENDVKIQVADEFNDYFSQVGYNLACVINSDGPPVVDDSNYALNSLFNLRTVTELDLQQYVDTLRGGSAPGYDFISASFLKTHFLSFSKPLLHLINLSISSGEFPDAFKIAKVIPLYKGNDLKATSNYRPISLLSVFSKVFEKIVKHQLNCYLNEHQILTDRQYGFRKSKNISDALFELTKDIDKALAVGKRCLLVFLDLAKAFDTVDRTKLLNKMDLIGIRGKAYSWFKSYLAKRVQFTTINGVNSDYKPVDYGVIQGSTLGPILFLIYINNLANIDISGKLYFFADDTAIFFESESWDSLFSIVTQDLTRVKKWFDQNLLTLNISKTKFMPISLRERSDTPILNLRLHTCGDFINDTCDCDMLERVNSFKYLGVMFDNRLSWSSHIYYTNGKLRKLIYAFRQLREVLTLKEIRIAYYAYAQSILEGGIIAWGGAYKSILNPLNVTQKAIIKSAMGRCRRYSSEDLYTEFSVLDVRQLYIRVLVSYVFKHPECISQNWVHEHSTRNTASFGLRIPRLIKTVTTTNSFYVAHVIHRNMPQDLRLSQCTFITFKHRVTEWLKTIGRENSELMILSNYRQ